MRTPVVTFATEQGPLIYQEDFATYFHFQNPSMRGWLLAVMDGHRGRAVAEFCANEIENLFTPDKPDSMEDTLRNLIAKLNAKTSHFDAGSTISLACILESHRKVVVAVLGDSPVFVLDTNGVFHQSPEHNARTNLGERRAAIKRGAVYENGYLFFNDGDNGPQYGLQMSRALGNAPLSRMLSREPEIYTIENPKWVLVASDGLIDPSHWNAEYLMSKFKAHAKYCATAKMLLEYAEKEGPRNDNTTALVWCREKR